MKYLLDTNICIYLIKRKPPQVLEKFRTLTPTDVGISTITVAELQYGVSKSQRREQNQAALSQFLTPLQIISFNQETTIIYGDIRAELESKGTPIGGMDMLIAAQAIALDLILVTNNVDEFLRIPWLKLENWTD